MSEGSISLQSAATELFVPAEGVSAREFDGEWIVLDLVNGKYFGLDEVAGLIWQQLTNSKTPIEIASDLATRYQIPADVILADTINLIVELTSQGLIKRAR